ncbi:hypothetical protein [Escherichia coli]|uniref:hypothetical protein n=1 Tax=Escherichia coli TaxID=562 RepID=UPI003D7A9273
MSKFTSDFEKWNNKVENLGCLMNGILFFCASYSTKLLRNMAIDYLGSSWRLPVAIISPVLCIAIFLILVQIISKKEQQIEWIETNAKITKSVISSNTWGTEVSHAKGETDRLVKLTIEIPLNNGETVVATKKVWSLTKNRNMFREGNYISILYNKKKPSQFKLKYQI